MPTHGTTLLALIDQMRECRKLQRIFLEEKNTSNYKAMKACEEQTDALLRLTRRHVQAHFKELNIEVLPPQ